MESDDELAKRYRLLILWCHHGSEKPGGSSGVSHDQFILRTAEVDGGFVVNRWPFAERTRSQAGDWEHHITCNESQP